MKTLLYIGILFVASVSVATGLSSCGPKCPSTNESKTYDFAAGDGATLTGFKGNETLMFIKNNKDTVRFECTSVQEYYINSTYPYGDCPRDYKHAHRKAVFTNAKEGDIVFHYYLSGQLQKEKEFELTFKKQLVGPITTDAISATIPLSQISINSRTFNLVKAFANNKDSVYINISPTDLPIYRLLRIKLDNNIYEVIPY